MNASFPRIADDRRTARQSPLVSMNFKIASRSSKSSRSWICIGSLPWWFLIFLELKCDRQTSHYILQCAPGGPLDCRNVFVQFVGGAFFVFHANGGQHMAR